MKRIFISYKRNVQPDESLAEQVYTFLKPDYDVFIDKSLQIGSNWGKVIEEKLRNADYFIPLISKDSVNSDMVMAEIETAYRISKLREGRPKILPIRVAYDEPLTYPLSAYLNRI